MSVSIFTITDGIVFYRDELVEELDREFDASTFRRPSGTGYGSFVVETRLQPLVGSGYYNGRYCGLDLDGLNDLIGRMGGVFAVRSEEVTALPDIRIADYKGTTVYFPTKAMLEKFHIARTRNSETA